MRRLTAFVVLLLLASPAGAQPPKRLQVIAQPTAAEAGLRTPAEPVAAETPPPAFDFSVAGSTSSLPAGLAFTRPLQSTAAGGVGSRTASQCRTACAQSYYFCLADEEEQSCNPRWARCVAGCS